MNNVVPNLIKTALLLGIGLLGILCVVPVIIPRRWTPQPPVPAAAMQVQTATVRDYTTVPDGVGRETRFVIDQPAADVRAFYRAELLRQGWTYRGLVPPGCGSHNYIEDIYDRGRLAQRSLSVRIVATESMDQQQVTVNEYERTLKFVPQPTAEPAATLPAALIGEWQANPATSDQAFAMCFYGDGTAEVRAVKNQIYRGTYQWTDKGLRVMYDFSQTVAASELRRIADGGLCRTLPALFDGTCNTRVAPLSGYPGYVAPSAPPFDPNDPTTYPGPQPVETVFVHIEVVFTAAVNEHTLTLTSNSGNTQTFDRIVRE